MKEISLLEIPGICIGQAQDEAGATGCTVIVCPEGAAAGLDVRGGGPASRESELLKPMAAAQRIHAVVLSGGSAYGLDAAGGVMRCLEEKGIGYDTGVALVPLVCQSCLFDLGVGDSRARPDGDMGYAACQNAWPGNYQDGNYGAGTGATVGKFYGMSYAMKSGIGSCAVQTGALKLGALVAVNAYGDVFCPQTGRQIAGLLAPDRASLRSTEEALFQQVSVVDNKFTGNTTLGVVVTNAAFSKAQLCKIASMAHNGYARCIRPVHTSADGDSIYALSTGRVAADMDMVGALAAQVMAQAIRNAVCRCASAYGFPCAASLNLAGGT